MSHVIPGGGTKGPEVAAPESVASGSQPISELPDYVSDDSMSARDTHTTLTRSSFRETSMWENPSVHTIQGSPSTADFMALIGNLNDQLRHIHSRFDSLDEKLTTMSAKIRERDEKIQSLDSEVRRVNYTKCQLKARISWLENKDYANKALFTGNFDLPPSRRPDDTEAAPIEANGAQGPDLNGDEVTENGSNVDLTRNAVSASSPVNGEEGSPSGGASVSDPVVFSQIVRQKLARLTRWTPTEFDGVTVERFNGRALLTIEDRTLRADLFKFFRKNRPSNYYLNEFLSPRVNKLLYNVKSLNSNRKVLFSIYTFHGRVFAKMTKESRLFPIDEIEEIAHLF